MWYKRGGTKRKRKKKIPLGTWNVVPNKKIGRSRKGDKLRKEEKGERWRGEGWGWGWGRGGKEREIKDVVERRGINRNLASSESNIVILSVIPVIIPQTCLFH